VASDGVERLPRIFACSSRQMEAEFGEEQEDAAILGVLGAGCWAKPVFGVCNDDAG
jgi:hypothetical protein